VSAVVVAVIPLKAISAKPPKRSDCSMRPFNLGAEEGIVEMIIARFVEGARCGVAGEFEGQPRPCPNRR
jgi:hypothetical protein